MTTGAATAYRRAVRVTPVRNADEEDVAVGDDDEEEEDAASADTSDPEGDVDEYAYPNAKVNVIGPMWPNVANDERERHICEGGSRLSQVVFLDHGWRIIQEQIRTKRTGKRKGGGGKKDLSTGYQV